MVSDEGARQQQQQQQHEVTRDSLSARVAGDKVAYTLQWRLIDSRIADERRLTGLFRASMS